MGIQFGSKKVSLTVPMLVLPVSTAKQAAELIAGAKTGFLARIFSKTGSATHLVSLLGRVVGSTKVDSKEIANLMKAVQVKTGKNEVSDLVAALLRKENKSPTLIKQFEMTHKVGLLNKHGRKIKIGTAGVAAAALIGSGIYFRKNVANFGQLAADFGLKVFAKAKALFV